MWLLKQILNISIRMTWHVTLLRFFFQQCHDMAFSIFNMKFMYELVNSLLNLVLAKSKARYSNYLQNLRMPLSNA